MNMRCLLAAVLVCASLVSSPKEVVTSHKDAPSEDYLWEILLEEAPNEYVAAGIMGYFWRESFYRSDAVAHWPLLKAQSGEDPCAVFTEKLDRANREEFAALVQNSGGYGLGQWYAESHLNSLYDFCKGYGGSFADARMQCLFTVHMCVTTPDLWNELKDADSAYTAGKLIGCLHDGSPLGAETIAAKARTIYRERITEGKEA